MRRYTGGKRRDASEKPIVAALRAIGCEVWHVSGAGLPDLLVLYRGRYLVCEVKTATGKRTKAQADVPWPIVRDVEDALAAIGALHGDARTRA